MCKVLRQPHVEQMEGTRCAAEVIEMGRSRKGGAEVEGKERKVLSKDGRKE